MNYNPYAAPQAPPPPGGPAAYAGVEQSWDFGEVLTAAFEGFKSNWAVLLGSNLVMMIVCCLLAFVPLVPVALGVFRFESAAGSMLVLVAGMLAMIGAAFLFGGHMRISLAVARGQQANFGDLFSGGDHFIPILGVLFLTQVAVLVGTMFLIVPGVVLGIGLAFSSYFVVDQRLGPIEALQASWKVTDGQKGKLFVFGLLCYLIVLGSEAVCCLPVLVAAPTVSLAVTIVFLRVTGRGAAAAFSGLPPGGGYGGPPGGGYGAPGGGYGGPPGGGYGGPPGGGYGGPPGGGYGGPPGGGYGGPPGGGYGGPPGGRPPGA